jgi:hypothetical protein
VDRNSVTSLFFVGSISKLGRGFEGAFDLLTGLNGHQRYGNRRCSQSGAACQLDGGVGFTMMAISENSIIVNSIE